MTATSRTEAVLGLRGVCKRYDTGQADYRRTAMLRNTRWTTSAEPGPA
jgi:hypothetical protein